MNLKKIKDSGDSNLMNAVVECFHKGVESIPELIDKSKELQSLLSDKFPRVIRPEYDCCYLGVSSVDARIGIYHTDTNHVITTLGKSYDSPTAVGVGYVVKCSHKTNAPYVVRVGKFGDFVEAFSQGGVYEMSAEEGKALWGEVSALCNEHR